MGRSHLSDAPGQHIPDPQKLAYLDDAGVAVASAALLKALFSEDFVHLAALNDREGTCVEKFDAKAVRNQASDACVNPAGAGQVAQGDGGFGGVGGLGNAQAGEEGENQENERLYHLEENQ